ncbi:transmembrane amino acid transporter protein-domain-containing protein [Aspergillus karnatakaensis]|uniref:transmembrane amino acid transporter protein-domain-containing protein n=1 Tax=Aspergillus karnatakaensis TaxID=1810916 RepID=UPI003CCD9DEF
MATAVHKEDLDPVPEQPEHTRDDVFGEISEQGPNYRNVGFVGTIILMMKTQIGLGVLAIPSALDTLGMGFGVACLIIMATITTWSGYVIGSFKLKHRDVYSLDDAGSIMFGLPGRAVLATAFCLYYIFNSGSAILSISIGLNAVSNHATCTAVFVAVAAIVGFALASIRTLGRITWLAWIGLPCIMTAIIIVTIAVGIQDRPAAAPPPTTTDGVWKSDWKAAGKPTFAQGIAAVSNLLFAFSGTPGFFSIISEMRNPKQYTAAVLICQSAVTATYAVIGCVIYFYCGSYVSSPALGSAGGVIKIVSYAFALPGLVVTMTIVTHIPSKYIFVTLLRGSKHLNANTAKHWLTWLACTSGITLIAWVIASTIPVFDALVSLIGALLGPAICIVPMGCMWLFDNYSLRERSIATGRDAGIKSHGAGTIGKGERSGWMWVFGVAWSVLLVVLGMFLMVAGTYGSVVGIVNSYSVAGGGGGRAFSCKDNSNSV